MVREPRDPNVKSRPPSRQRPGEGEQDARSPLERMVNNEYTSFIPWTTLLTANFFLVALQHTEFLHCTNIKHTDGLVSRGARDKIAIR